VLLSEGSTLRPDDRLESRHSLQFTAMPYNQVFAHYCGFYTVMVSELITVWFLIGGHSGFVEQTIVRKLRQDQRPENPTAAPWRWLALTASLLLIASVTWNIAQLRSRVDPRQLLAWQSRGALRAYPLATCPTPIRTR
jgi:heme/copper-type cytochrome/quinol oxidase subunit 3